MNILEIRSLDMEARGIGHIPNEDGSQGKVVFVEGALPGETVVYSSFKKKPSFEMANMTTLLHESPQRVKPRCDWYSVCGGCSMQHLDANAQVAMKQRVLEDNLTHIGKVKPEVILRPIIGPTWGYRYRARLSVRHVLKKNKVLVGFHEKKSRYVADMQSCEILPPHVSKLLVPLADLIAGLSIVDQIPQIELAVGETSTVMVLRIMAALSDTDQQALREFADLHQIQWWLQTKGPETATPFYPAESDLHYLLPEFGVKMPFKPTDFTQVNHQINRVLVARALRLLAPEQNERIADLFCGLGNFTLPIATLVREVVGIEGSSALTERAMANAQANQLAQKLSFQTRNLFEFTADDLLKLGEFDRMLIDPPRDGAMAVCQALADIKANPTYRRPKRLVYVSCSPSTLARDAGILVHQAGYRMSYGGVVNMFPHTSHVESMAVFDLIEE